MNTEIDQLTEESTFQTTLDTFYRLKGEYETKLEDAKRKISKKSHLTTKEKRDEYKRIKAKCVNCNRNVGSIFEVKYNKEAEARIAKAMCGDRINPCPLNIEINLGKILNLASEVNEHYDQIVKLKQQVVTVKNDLLFGYVAPDQAVESFNTLKEELEDATKDYELLLISYNNMYEHVREKDELIELEKQIYTHIESIKTMVIDYNKENNTQYITDAVTLYISQLMPKIREYQQLKFPVQYTEPIGKFGCRLVQERKDIVDTEIDMSLEPKSVIAFEMGMKAKQSKESNKKNSSKEQNSTTENGIEFTNLDEEDIFDE